MEANPEKYKIIPENLDPEDREAAADHLDERREEAVQPLENEPQKSEEERKVVDKINEYFREEMEALGFEFKPINPDQFHLLEGAEFKRHFPKIDERTGAFYSPKSSAIYLDKTKNPDRLGRYKVMFHEAGHYFSYQVYHANVDTRKLGEYRTGYLVDNPNEDEHSHFRGLNEAVLDKIVMEMLNKNKEDLLRTIDATQEEPN
jgi:hypothetical protein